MVPVLSEVSSIDNQDQRSELDAGAVENVRAFLARLEGCHEAGPNQWQTRCPAHPDEKPSLSVSVCEGRILVHCHAGCAPEAVVAALGLTMADLFSEGERPGPGMIAKTYDYRDERGMVLFQVVRKQPKGFFQRRPDGHGGWIDNVKGVRRVLYRLPELVAADPVTTVFIVEGEKDADRLAGLGLVATTNPGGAGEWRAEYSEVLGGRHVIIIPDNDQAGRNHAAKVKRSLTGIARALAVLELAGLPPKGDVSDWLESHDVHELAKIAEDALRSCVIASPRRTMYTAAELLSMDIPGPRWVVEGIVPEGLTLLAGKPKIGKSWLCLQLALLVAGGGPGLGTYMAPIGDVLYLALEDSTRRLRQRLDALLSGKPGPAALHLATAWDRFLDGGLDRLEAFLQEHPGTRLIVVDTLARVRAMNNGRKSAYEIDYGDLAGPQSLAGEHPGLGILVLHHLRKNLAVDPLDLVSGTTGLTASADTVLVMSRGRGTDRFDARIFLTGRDVEEREFALKRENGSPRWRVLGDAAEFAMSEQQQKIVAFLRELGEPAGPKVIADRTGVLHGSVKHLVGKLVDQGLLLRADNGTYTTNPIHSRFPDHPDHRVHPTHSDRSSDGVPDGECPSFTDESEPQTEQSSSGERGERSNGEIDSARLEGRDKPLQETGDQGEHGGEP